MGNFSIINLITLAGFSFYLTSSIGCIPANTNRQSLQRAKEALEIALAERKQAIEDEKATKKSVEQRIKALEEAATEEARLKSMALKRLQDLQDEKRKISFTEKESEQKNLSKQEAEQIKASNPSGKVTQNTVESDQVNKEITNILIKELEEKIVKLKAELFRSTQAQTSSSQLETKMIPEWNNKKELEEEIKKLSDELAKARQVQTSSSQPETLTSAELDNKNKLEEENQKLKAELLQARQASTSSSQSEAPMTDESDKKKLEEENKKLKVELLQARQASPSSSQSEVPMTDEAKKEKLEEEIKTLKAALLQARQALTSSSQPEVPMTNEANKKAEVLVQDKNFIAKLDRFQNEDPDVTETEKENINTELDNVIKALNQEISPVNQTVAMQKYEELLKGKVDETSEQQKLRVAVLERFLDQAARSPKLSKAMEEYNDKVGKEQEKQTIVERKPIYQAMFDTSQVDLKVRVEKNPILKLIKHDRGELKSKLKMPAVIDKMLSFSQFASIDELKALWTHLAQGGISPNDIGVSRLVEGIKSEIERREGRIVYLDSEAYRTALMKQDVLLKKAIVKKIKSAKDGLSLQQKRLKIAEKELELQNSDTKISLEQNNASVNLSKQIKPSVNVSKQTKPTISASDAKKLALDKIQENEATLARENENLKVVQARLNNADTAIKSQKKELNEGKDLATEEDMLVRATLEAENNFQSAKLALKKIEDEILNLELQQRRVQIERKNLDQQNVDRKAQLTGDFNNLSSQIKAQKKKIDNANKAVELAKQAKKEILSKQQELQFPYGTFQSFLANEDYANAGYDDVKPAEKIAVKDEAYYVAEAEKVLTELNKNIDKLKSDNTSVRNLDQTFSDWGKKKPFENTKELFVFLDKIELQKEVFKDTQKFNFLEELSTAIKGLYRAEILVEKKITNVVIYAGKLGIVK